jgi:hypothetical protein
MILLRPRPLASLATSAASAAPFLLLAAGLISCSTPASPPAPSTPAPPSPPIASAPAVVSVTAPSALSAPLPRPAGFAQRRSLASQVPSSFGAAADERYAYGVTYEGHDGVFRVPRGGGAAEVLAPDQEWSRDLAVDDATIYWVRGHGATPGGAVSAMPKAGGAVREIAPHEADAHLVAVDSTHVYWANGGGYDGGGGTGKAEIRRMRKQGGPVETVAAMAGVVRLQLADDALYVLADSGPSSGSGIVARVPKSGGAVTVLAASGPSPADLDLDDTHLYWTLRGEFEMPPPVLCKSATPCPVATTAPIVRHGELHRVARAGGPVEVLARDLVHAGSLVLGAQTILFAAGGELFELPKSGGAKVSRGPGVSSRFAVSGGEVFAFSGTELFAFGP